MKKIFVLKQSFVVSAALLFFTHCIHAQNTYPYPATGPIGIGTSTPDASSILDVASTTKGMLIPRMTIKQRNNIVSPAPGLLVYQTTSTPGFYYYNGSQWNAVSGWSLTGNAGTAATNFLGTTDNHPLIFRTNNIEQMRINGAGNIGVGITSPNAKLDVAGDVRVNGNKIYLSSGTDANHFLGYDATLDGPLLSGYGGGGLGGTAPNTTVLRWTWDGTAGNVGIGITSPNAKLDVGGDVRLNDNKIFLRSGTDGFHSLGFDATLNGPLLSGYGGGGLGGTANTSTTVLRWTWDGTNGNVGIGTNTPAYKLDVCGTIRAKEVRVETGWCDYVFENDYKLPSLKDVETYIIANKHLPGVTPGPVIEKEGLEVGKTSEQMIKKIEELTLYVIDLQKQIDQLKKDRK